MDAQPLDQSPQPVPDELSLAAGAEPEEGSPARDLPPVDAAPLVTVARLGLPPGYAWSERLAADVERYIRAPAAAPPWSAQEASLLAQVAALVRPSDRQATRAAEEPATVAALLRHYARAHALRAHAQARLTAFDSIVYDPRTIEEPALYYLAYLYLIMDASGADDPAAEEAYTADITAGLARYQWLAAVGTRREPEGLLDDHHGEWPAIADAAPLTLNYLPDVAYQARVRMVWRQLVASLADLQPELVAAIAERVALTGGEADARSGAVLGWLVEAVRGRDPALAQEMEQLLPDEPVAPGIVSLFEAPPLRPAPPTPPADPDPVPPARPVQPVAAAAPGGQPAGAAPPAPAPDDASADLSAPRADDINRIWFHYHANNTRKPRRKK
jgi:hypothetical protein